MRSLLTITTLAFAGIAGIAYAQQTLDPYEPNTHGLDSPPAREVYIAQGPTGPEYIEAEELRTLKRDARFACGDRPNSMLDLVAWKLHRKCVFVAADGTPYYPYKPRID